VLSIEIRHSVAPYRLFYGIVTRKSPSLALYASFLAPVAICSNVLSSFYSSSPVPALVIKSSNEGDVQLLCARWPKIDTPPPAFVLYLSVVKRAFPLG